MGVFHRLRYYYWNYGGLLEDIYLQVTPRVTLTQLRAQGTAEGRLTLYPFGVNATGHPQKVTTMLPDGDGAASTTSLTAPHPRLWSLQHPNLYTVHLSILKPRLRTTLSELSGFRDISIQGAQPYLNGKPVDELQGFNRHADYPGLSRTQPPGLVDQEMKQLYDKGSRLFRSAHFPTTPVELNAADKCGMLALEETNVTGMSGAELASPEVINFVHQQLKLQIDRDRSHPSILHGRSPMKTAPIHPDRPLISPM